MAGIALLMDLFRKNPTFSTQTLHSSGLLSATVAASAAAASVAAGKPFASRFLFGDGGVSIAYADASAAEWTDNYMSNLRTASENFFQRDVKYAIKEYPLEMKPILSAFGLRSFGATTLRSLLMFYLPLLEPRSRLEEDDDDDDDDFPEDVAEEKRVDLVLPLKKSVKQIFRETTVVTTRRLLERLAVHYVSRRMAWKLLKDVRKSACRKATRGMPTLVYFGCVSRTTFRAHLLGVTASWLVQIGIEVYRCFSYLIKRNEEEDKVDTAERIKVFTTKASVITLKCGASLICASIGAGIGALFHPAAGQWIGCAAGDWAGPILVTLCLDRALPLDP